MERKKIIVADSSANLTSEDEGFKSVPLKIIIGENEFVDDENLNVTEMLDCLNNHKGKSSTSCPSVGDWLEAFGNADEVYGISITSHLSGSYNAANIAANEYIHEYPGRKVFILDSLSTGPEMELLIEKFNELIVSNKTFEEICNEIQEYRERTHLIFFLGSISNLARNGRVNHIVAVGANLLGIRIVGQASIHGELEVLHKSKGESKAISKLWQTMLEKGYKGGKVRICHTDNEKAALQLESLIKQEFADCDIKIGANKGLCSYYSEKGGLLVGFES
jgi:DegV family protein with EDD domain